MTGAPAGYGAIDTLEPGLSISRLKATALTLGLKRDRKNHNPRGKSGRYTPQLHNGQACHAA